MLSCGLCGLQRIKVKPLYTVKDLEGKEDLLNEVWRSRLRCAVQEPNPLGLH
jgi:hypothetical protein